MLAFGFSRLCAGVGDGRKGKREGSPLAFCRRFPDGFTGTLTGEIASIYLSVSESACRRMWTLFERCLLSSCGLDRSCALGVFKPLVLLVRDKLLPPFHDVRPVTNLDSGACTNMMLATQEVITWATVIFVGFSI